MSLNPVCSTEFQVSESYMVNTLVKNKQKHSKTCMGLSVHTSK